MGLSSTEIVIIGVVSGLVVAILVYLILRNRRRIKRQFSGEFDKELGTMGQVSGGPNERSSQNFDASRLNYGPT